MSIQALCGLPGHGKSYSAIELFIIEALKQHRVVVTNIPLLETVYDDYPDADIRSIDLDDARVNDATWDEIPGGSIVLLDELWRIWPAGLKPNDIPIRQLSFIKEHRHHLSDDGREMDIVLVTQVLDDICNSVRGMVETTIICNKLTEVGAKNRFRRDYYRGAIKGIDGPKSKFFHADHNCQYLPEIYKYYKSHTKSDGTVSKGGNSGIVNKTIFSSFKFRAGLFILFLCIVFSIYGFISTRDKLTVMTKPKESQINPIPDAGIVKPMPAVQPVLPSAPVVTDSLRYRLTGRAVFDRRATFIVYDFEQKRSIRLGNSFCKYDKEFNNFSCNFQGHLITPYSGSPPSAPIALQFSQNQVSTIPR
jgi:zona occludens toxin